MIIPMHPGEIKIIAAPKKPKKGTWVDSLFGKYADDSGDSFEELKKYKKRDLELEKRKLSL